MSVPLHHLFITPVFAYSTCRMSWAKFELLSSPTRQSNFILLFFELGALLLFSSCFFHFFSPSVSILFHIFCTLLFPSLPPTFFVEQFPSPCQAQGLWPQSTLLWQMPFSLLEMQHNYSNPNSVIKLYSLDLKVYCP